MIRACALLVLVVHAISSACAAEPRLWGNLVSGNYQVGFRTIKIASGGSPALELSLWYPAQSSSKPPVTFADYFLLSSDLIGAEPNFFTDAGARYRTLSTAITGDPSGIDDSQAELILSSPMAAIKNAPPVAGHFPLVLWTPRYGTTAAQSVMSEFLVSRGYVVAFARRLENPIPLPFQAKDEPTRVAALRDMVSDMTRAFGALKNERSVNTEQTAIIAWSYTGEAATAFQLTQPSVKLVIGYSTPLLRDWVYRRPELAKTIVKQIRVPYALFSEMNGRDGKEKIEPEALAALSSDAYYLRIPGAAHGTFNALEGYIPALIGISKVQPWSVTGESARKSYEVTAALTLRLLDHYFFETHTQTTPFQGALPGADVNPEDYRLDQHAKRNPLPQPKFKTVKFRTIDNVEVAGDLYASSKKATVVVMLHQSGNSRGEYRQIAPHLVGLGLNVLAIDVRWGGKEDRWNKVRNQTAAAFGTASIISGGDRNAFRKVRAGIPFDIQAAIDWLEKNGYTGQKLLWGSSITANSVLEYAAQDQARLVAVLPFSPGEYQPDEPQRMQNMVRNIRIPVFVACGYDELDLAQPIYDAIPGNHKQLYRAIRGRHGSSILLDDSRNWSSVENFLKRIVTARQ